MTDKGAITEEIWMPVVGYETKYKISSIGRLKNIRTDHLKKPQKTMRGYTDYGLWDGNKKKLIKAHKMVWYAFAGEIPSGMQINHINGNKRDNRIENLEIVSGRDNVNHAHLGRKQSSMFPGVHKYKGRWQAACTIEGKQRHIGRYDTEIEAARAYMDFLMDNGLSIKYAMERYKAAEKHLQDAIK